MSSALTAVVLSCILIGLYVGFSSAAKPHRVPVAVVTKQEPAQQVGVLAGPALQAHPVGDRKSGLTLLRNGRVSAVISTTPIGLRLDVATAAGPTTATSIEEVVSAAAAKLHRPLSTYDTVPLSPTDRRGLAMFFTGLSLSLASSSLAHSLNRAHSRPTWWQRVCVTGVFGALSGLAGALVTGPLLGALPGPVLSVAATLALLSVAGALTTQALAQWLGPPGYAATTVLFVAVGMPTSGGIVGVHLLPTPARTVSELLPPGAAVRAVRSYCYFHGVQVTVPLLTLAGWIAAAAVLLWMRDGRYRQSE
ncbi:hypothetical protein [Streptomyces cylindrosporus]|uniref:ABC transporter permease n=1 Tax=Streptomyces cylindrosporus TaxID=2927583 RepID=A0ABS9Y841_9ACTN|nr:hypothetical protein [Streptomyces cylindrosporus]MCI3273398.1 hypothetical protein [Streptomyces cylindrosporus]